MLKKLASLPQGIDDCYCKTFQKLHAFMGSELGHNFLLLMVSSQELLTDAEVRYLLSMEAVSDDTQFQNLVKSTEVVFPLRARQEADGRRVKEFQPYHKTIVDWLTDDSKAGRELFCDPTKGHTLIARRLLRKSQIFFRDRPMEGEVTSRDVGSLVIDGFSLLALSTETPMVLYMFKYLLTHLDSSQSNLGYAWISYFLLTNLSLEMVGMSHVMEALQQRISNGHWLESNLQCKKDMKLLKQLLGLIVSARKFPGFSSWRQKLCTQISGRLDSSKLQSARIRNLVETSREYLQTHEGWQFIQPSLQEPGGALEMLLMGHTDAVTSLCVLGDGRLASGSDDNTVRI